MNIRLHWLSTLAALLLSIACAEAQEVTQSIRGSVIDAESHHPLIGANVVLLNSDPLRGATTDIDGQFKLEEVPIGRHDLEITYIGYEPVVLSSLLLTAGKELVLQLELIESAISMQVVEVVATSDKAETLNEMATVSARSFSVEETSRYASSFYDPARMARNFAGVTLGGSGDLENEIIVRGNSPRGVLWRLEGIEIPNPNHFSALGGSGGAISMLSSSTLSTSDFYTGAFPAEFGNASSGVFDLNLRTGNNDHREYAFMIGALGIEAAAEGPFSAGGRASYLVNFRYSTLAALKAVGLNPVGDVLPEYQDLSFKVNLPTGKMGTFSLFGLGGTNRAFYDPEPDSLSWVDTEFEEYGFEERNKVGTLGLSHRLLLTDHSYLRTVVAVSGEDYTEEIYWLDSENNYDRVLDETAHFLTKTARVSSTYTHKFNARHTLRAGGIASHYDFSYDLQYVDDSEDVLKTVFASEGKTQLYQAFAQWKYRLNDKWTLNNGVHYTYFALNGNYSIEPRTALQWQLSERHALSIAAGIHSKPEHVSFYFIEETVPGQARTTPNHDLEIMKSAQLVLGYDWRLSENLRLKTEAYYQHLYDVPVENDPTQTGAVLNSADLWDIIGAEPAVNDGKGRNYGVDLTLERFFADQYYFMVTGSLFESKYTPLNGIEYDTRYNSNYQLNVLGGKEFKVGKGKDDIFGINLKLLLAGGNRNTPIDLAASIEKGETVWVEDQPWAIKNPDYFRTDIGLSYKINGKHITHTILLDVQNVTNRQNIYFSYYDDEDQRIETYNQTGLFPNFNYRIEF